MKVSTDACIQGAWLPLDATIKRALDIGTGTGLLALMLAQRAPQLSIDALEIDRPAAAQAAENIEASPFRSQINVCEADARSFQPHNLYDLIVCNPPFFSQDLTGPDVQRNTVRHDALLTADDLVSLAGRALQPAGRLCVMWPDRRTAEWHQLMSAAGFFAHAALKVRNKTGARASSNISVWSKVACVEFREEELIIRSEDGNYTPHFTALLNDYYLRLS